MDKAKLELAIEVAGMEREAEVARADLEAKQQTERNTQGETFRRQFASVNEAFGAITAATLPKLPDERGEFGSETVSQSRPIVLDELDDERLGHGRGVAIIHGRTSVRAPDGVDDTPGEREVRETAYQGYQVAYMFVPGPADAPIDLTHRDGWTELPVEDFTFTDIPEEGDDWSEEALARATTWMENSLGLARQTQAYLVECGRGPQNSDTMKAQFEHLEVGP